MHRRLWLLLITLFVALAVFGCASSSRPQPEVARRPVARDARSALAAVFGSRLGRLKEYEARGTRQGACVQFEIRGTASEPELLRALLGFSETRPNEATITVLALLPDQRWSISGLEWRRSSGHLLRWKGDGGEPMVVTYPAGQGARFASTTWTDGEMPSGIDGAALARMASGEQIARWKSPDR